MTAHKDFFVSYTGADRRWAEWIAWQLKAAGYLVTLQAWDFTPGRDFVHEMQRATTEAVRTIAVLSPAYLASRFGEAEWRVAFQEDPTGERGLLVPVRVADVDPPGLLATRVYIDLVGLDRQAAKVALLAGVQERGASLSAEPGYPGDPPAALAAEAEEPGYPGELPAVWNVPYRRNPLFTGRSTILEALHASFARPRSAQPQVLVGMGGVGKTQLAVEYAYRCAADYDQVWWIRAEDSATLRGEYAALAAAVGIPEVSNQDDAIAAVRAWLERHHRWLLILDNIEEQDPLEELLPRSGGRVLLTTQRDDDWAPLAQRIPVDVLEPDEATSFLQARSHQDDQDAAGQLATALGRLPLALEQAGAFLTQSKIITLANYAEMFEQRSLKLLARAQRPGGYAHTVDTTWVLALEQLRQQAPGAIELLGLSAFLGPEDLPAQLLVTHADLLPTSLATHVGNWLGLADLMRALGRYSLVKVEHEGLFVHRLLQAVIRANLDHASRQQWADAAVRLLQASFPDHGEDWSAWEDCRRLLPHALAATEHAQQLGVNPAATAWLLDRIARYATGRAQYKDAKGYLEQAISLVEPSQEADLGELAVLQSDVAVVLSHLGEIAQARTSAQQALELAETAFGPDHPEVAARLAVLGGVLRDLGGSGRCPRPT